MTTTPRWAEHPAPPPLTLLQEFVNTHAYAGRPDRLATATSTRVWLRAQGLRATPTAADRARLVLAREALRDALQHRHGAPARLPPDLRTLARGIPDPSFTWDLTDGVTLTGTGRGVDRFVNDLAAAVVSASVAGTWGRLKVCDNDECRVAFWDRTKNGSARFCSATVCANRARQRSHRARSGRAGGREVPAKADPRRVPSVGRQGLEP